MKSGLKGQKRFSTARRLKNLSTPAVDHADLTEFKLMAR